MRRLNVFPLLLSLLVLTACGSLLESDGPAISTWWLEPTDLSPVKNFGAPLTVDLSVVPGLDTDRILTLDDAARLNHFAGARWPEHLPEVLNSLLVRSLESGLDAPVRRGDYARSGECLLNLEVRAFWARLGEGLSARRVDVTLAGQLACPDGEHAVGAERRETVGQDRLPVIVAAFQRALDGAFEDVAAQLAAASP